MFLSEADSVLGRVPPQTAIIRRQMAEVVRRLREYKYNAYFFGGSLRDLVIRPESALPRDVDIVVDAPSNAVLADRFADLCLRQTRFGGIRLRRGLLFDIWALPETWAFKTGVISPAFEGLPSTTFLNIEAVVAQLYACPGEKRIIHEKGFYDAVAKCELEINFEPNPYPALCVIRSLIMAEQLGFSIGRRLARYIIEQTGHASAFFIDLIEAQRSHYGAVRWPEDVLRQWISSISDQYDRSVDRIAIPDGQASLFDDYPESVPRRYVRLKKQGGRKKRSSVDEEPQPELFGPFAVIGQRF